MLREHAPVFVVVFPLLGAFAVTLAGIFARRACFSLVIVTLGLTLVCGLSTMGSVLSMGGVRYSLGNWSAPIGIEYNIDHLSSLMLVLVPFVALISALGSRESVQLEMSYRAPYFYTLFLLLVSGLLGICATGDAFNLYVMIEVSALTTYALIAAGREKAYIATFHYIILGTIGASFYLLGVGYLYIKTGTLNMADLSQLLPELHDSATIQVAFVLLVLGISVKMALVPLHSWLPNAYTYAPGAASTLIAPLATKVSVYVLARILLTVFSVDYVFETFGSATFMVGLASVAVVYGATAALMQTDLRKMLAYILVAEVGYMAGGIWLGNELGLTGALYHIGADSLATLTLFMAVTMISFRAGKHSLDEMTGLCSKMPITMAIFVIGGLSMIGVPPLGGFFSKFYLISGALESNQWWFAVALVFASLVNAVLFFRLFERAFIGKGHHQDETEHSYNEAPASMVAAGVLAASALVFFGVGSSGIIDTLILPVTEGVF